MQAFGRTGLGALGAIAAIALASACTPTPATDPAFEPGALGNGSFVFACDDAFACDPYSGTADKFPKQVSLGATFSVRFVAKGETAPVNPSTPTGQTLGAVGNAYLGPAIGGGFDALKPGFATIAARNAQGFIVDFVTLEITKPDSLAIYDASQLSSFSKVSLDKVTLKVDEQLTLRALPRSKSQDLAGSLRYEWTPGDSSGVVAVGSATQTTATIVGKKVGTSTVSVTGGTFSQSLSVEVTQ
jgi:hypothetical protein